MKKEYVSLNSRNRNIPSPSSSHNSVYYSVIRDSAILKEAHHPAPHRIPRIELFVVAAQNAHSFVQPAGSKSRALQLQSSSLRSLIENACLQAR